MKTITISRAKWLRGVGSNESALLKGGKMCCLGFVSIQCGLMPHHIEGLKMPAAALDDEKPSANPFPTLTKYKHGIFQNTSLASQIAGVNDASEITDWQREKKLAALARRAGFNFVFVP